MIDNTQQSCDEIQINWESITYFPLARYDNSKEDGTLNRIYGHMHLVAGVVTFNRDGNLVFQKFYIRRITESQFTEPTLNLLLIKRYKIK